MKCNAAQDGHVCEAALEEKLGICVIPFQAARLLQECLNVSLAE